MEIEANREKHPWPEVEPQTCAPMGRRWLSFTLGPLKTRPVDMPHGLPFDPDGGTYYPPRIAKCDIVENLSHDLSRTL